MSIQLVLANAQLIYSSLINPSTPKLKVAGVPPRESWSLMIAIPIHHPQMKDLESLHDTLIRQDKTIAPNIGKPGAPGISPFYKTYTPGGYGSKLDVPYITINIKTYTLDRNNKQKIRPRIFVLDEQTNARTLLTDADVERTLRGNVVHVNLNVSTYSVPKESGTSAYLTDMGVLISDRKKGPFDINSFQTEREDVFAHIAPQGSVVASMGQTPPPGYVMTPAALGTYSDLMAKGFTNDLLISSGMMVKVPSETSFV